MLKREKKIIFIGGSLNGWIWPRPYEKAVVPVLWQPCYTVYVHARRGGDTVARLGVLGQWEGIRWDTKIGETAIVETLSPRHCHKSRVLSHRGRLAVQ